MQTRNKRYTKGEAGFAVPTVLMATIAVFATGMAVLTAAVTTQGGVSRDQSSKEALAAAESGVAEALLHYNRIVGSEAEPCLAGEPAAPSARTNPADSASWCAPVGPRALAGVTGGEFTYWVRPISSKPWLTPDILEIVSEGTVNGQSRTVQVVARSSAGLQPFADSAGVIGLDSISGASNGAITGDVGTNGDISLGSNAHVYCNYAHVGVGRGFDLEGTASYTCTGNVEYGTLSLPPVNQGDVPTNNSNARIGLEDPFSGSQYTWDPTTRELSLGSNTTLTLGGANYSFCRVTLGSNSAIYIDPDATQVHAYFDAPENCPSYSAAAPRQLELKSNSRLSASGDSPSQLALLFVGSDTLSTSALMGSNTQADGCEQDFVVYAPRTTIEMNSNSSFCGAIAGQSITLGSNADITQSNFATDFVLPNTVAHHYDAEEFRDCGAVAKNPPDAGC